MRYFLSFLLCIISLCSMGQSSLGKDIAASLHKSQFYFVGQGHNNGANTIIEKELLLALNDKYNVQYDILEYSHSAAFLINQYLQTGNEAFLKCINSAANFNFVKAIKAHNDTISKNKSIRFYGLDFENRHNGKYTRKAIETILQELKLPASEALTSVLRNIVECQTKEIEPNLSKQNLI